MTILFTCRAAEIYEFGGHLGFGIVRNPTVAISDVDSRTSAESIDNRNHDLLAAFGLCHTAVRDMHHGCTKSVSETLVGSNDYRA